MNQTTSLLLIGLLGAASMVACASDPDDDSQSVSSAIRGDRDDDDDDAHDGRGGHGRKHHHDRKCGKTAGERLFNCETFDGNGRTCATCHGEKTGTFSPREAQALYAKHPNAPLFRAIDSDDGLGTSYSRLLNDAVIRIRIDLPANVTANHLSGCNPDGSGCIEGADAGRSIFFNRGVPTTLNTPALDPILMSDGREPTLTSQANGAIHAHMQPGVAPTARQLEQIAEYEKTLFSSKTLEAFASRGRVPELPPGRTAAEKRGRLAFLDGPQGKCAFCHSGPMLNRTNAFNINPNIPPGSAFETALVSEFNFAGNPRYRFRFTNPDGSVTTVDSPDPGRGLVTGNAFDSFPVANFKIPTVWNAKNTAPYFHDNSAKTLEELMVHYQQFFGAAAQIFGRPDVVMSDQERDDILAYMKLL